MSAKDRRQIHSAAGFAEMSEIQSLLFCHHLYTA